MTSGELDGLIRESLRAMFARPLLDLKGSLDDLGWTDVVAESGRGAWALLLSEHARSLSRSPALDLFVATELGLDPAIRFLWPGDHRRSAELAIGGPGLTLAEGLMAGPVGASVAAPAQGQLWLADVDRWDEQTPVGVDPASGWRDMRGQIRWRQTLAPWAAAASAANLGLAIQLIASAQACLDAAITYVGQRTQFGRPIGSYQAVRHRLAGSYALLAGGEALVNAALAEGSESAAKLAKASAAEAHNAVSREAIQVCGGIGLSAEFVLVEHVRRGMLLGSLLDSADDVDSKVGADLVAGVRPVPIARF